MCQDQNKTITGREKAVDVIKAIGIIGVVLHHIHFPNTTEAISTYDRIIDSIFCCDLYIFLFVSGYLTKRYFGYDSVKTFIVKRTKRLLIPYLWFGLIYLAIFQVGSSLGLTVLADRASWNIKDCFIALLTLDNFHTVGAHLYYLILIYVVSLLFLFFGKTDRMQKKEVIILSAFFTGLVLMRHLGLLSHAGFKVGTILPGLFIFVLGYMYSKTKAQTKLWIILGISMVALSVFSDMIRNSFEMTRVIAPFILFAALSHFTLEHPAFQFIQKIGMSTPTIFIYHKPIMMRGFAFVFYSLGMPVILSSGFTVIFTLIVCLGLYRIAIRYRVPRLIIYY